MKMHLMALVICWLAVTALVQGAERGATKPDKSEQDKADKADLPRLFPRGPTIESFKQMFQAGPELIAQIQAGVEANRVKDWALQGKPEVIAATRAVAEAKRALEEAEHKLEEARGGYNLLQENKRVVYERVSPEQREQAAKFLSYNPLSHKLTVEGVQARVARKQREGELEAPKAPQTETK